MFLLISALSLSILVSPVKRNTNYLHLLLLEGLMELNTCIQLAHILSVLVTEKRAGDLKVIYL